MTTVRGHVSVLNAARARENIEAKVQLLRSAVRAVDKEQLEKLPTTLRQFNHWVAHTNEVGPGLPQADVRTNSNESVRRVPELRQAVMAAVQEVIDVKKQATEHSRENRLAAIRRRLDHSERLRSIAERELGEAMIRLEEASAEVRKLRASVSSQANTARDEIDKLERELAAERRKNSELVASQKKVSRIGRVS